ncbi:MAG: UPF0175 family protein [Panacagrimonas sp.]
MQMIVDVPNHFPDAVKLTPQEFERDARLAMAAKLYELRRLSSGMAAQLVGLDRRDFLMELSRFGVAVHDLPPEELATDVANA